MSKEIEKKIKAKLGIGVPRAVADIEDEPIDVAPTAKAGNIAPAAAVNE